MKRIIALLLSLVIICSCGMVAASAQTEKLSAGLHEKLKTCDPDDTVTVYITYAFTPKAVTDMPSWPDITAARAEYREYRLSKQEEIQLVVFDGIEYKVIVCVSPDDIVVEVAAADVYIIAENDLVSYIDRFDDEMMFPEENTADLLFFDKFDAKYGYDDRFSCYKELYYSFDNDGEIAWVLLYVESYMMTEEILYGVIGNRLICHFGTYYPFEFGYGIYLVKENDFIPVDSRMIDSYDGLVKAFDEFGDGKLLGDVDGDDAITVIDVTIIQRCEAAMREYPAEDKVTDIEFNSIVQYYSDFNRDGERDILDATCMQRYLAGMKYPIG